MSVPCSIRIDYRTILANPEMSSMVKSLGDWVMADEELVMTLYFMR
jgi:hypothetical protein